MDLQVLSSLFATIQAACLPGVWSKGVALSRGGGVIQDQVPNEWVFRVRVADKPVSNKVSLWPEDEDWYCDCQDRNDVCSHVAAVVIALKAGKVSSPELPKASTGQLQYRLSRKEGRLSLDRWLVFGDKKEQVLSESLVAFVGGIGSGRIPSVPLAVTREDYAVDAALNDRKRGELERPSWIQLFKALSACSSIYLDGLPVLVSTKPLQIRASLNDEGSGFRIRQVEDPTITEVFSNGVALCSNVLRGIEVPLLSDFEREVLAGKGRLFTGAEVKSLITEILPRLEKKMPIEILSSRLPRIRQVAPRIVLEFEKSSDHSSGTHTLSVVPVLKAENSSEKGGTIGEILVSDPEEERKLLRKLQSELQLSPGQRVLFEGESAVDFLLKAKGWELSGNGVQAFALHSALVSTLEFDQNNFQNHFEVHFDTQSRDSKRADPNLVFRAWRENKNYVPLLGGGWAPLPKDWLSRYADRVEELLAFKNSKNSLPAYLVPAVGELCQETGRSYSDSIRSLEDLLSHVEKIPEAELPKDLNASLRPYQKQGVNWLSFLRNGQNGSMGAMLADDMGLGKTLQALCVVQGRTLVISPTSVLFGWAKQIEQFRPQLSYSVYYGNQRTFNRSSQVVLTSYAILRLDREVLASEDWDTIILDEAQVIKNPDSQTTRAVYSLRGGFRLALSGTPLENRLEDLWSQFQFINPGLLGSLESFQERYSGPMSRGDNGAAERLRKMVKPFILRRLKKEVATDLPPRTEKVLHCELSREERDVYESILVSTRKEILERIGAGGSVFGALELLLRLRQACCHPTLIPGIPGVSGVSAGSASLEGSPIVRSAKVELLVQTLMSSVSCGHRGLVFSQWTSYLDLIEPELTAQGIRFSRLDGSTQNRDQIVEEFQKTDGPAVMLISLKAGGVGLTLTAADHIFLMDPWWNPAVEDQAADRAHRIGQVNPVLIHRLIAKETIEERILELQKSKLAMAASVLQDAGAAASITREDLLALLN